jgi:hypothetical protein
VVGSPERLEGGQMMMSNGTDAAGAQVTPVTPKGPSGPPVTVKDQDEQARLSREATVGQAFAGCVPAQAYDETGRVPPPPAGTAVDWLI